MDDDLRHEGAENSAPTTLQDNVDNCQEGGARALSLEARARLNRVFAVERAFLHKKARAVTGTKQDADDVVQIVLSRVFDHVCAGKITVDTGDARKILSGFLANVRKEFWRARRRYVLVDDLEAIAPFTNGVRNAESAIELSRATEAAEELNPRERALLLEPTIPPNADGEVPDTEGVRQARARVRAKVRRRIGRSRADALTRDTKGSSPPRTKRTRSTGSLPTPSRTPPQRPSSR